MKIPQNRTYRIRSTVRKPAVSRDPGFGLGARAMADAMTPGIRASIDTLHQQQKWERERARTEDGHWKTHVEIADAIGRTALRVGRALDERAEREEREEERSEREEERLEAARERKELRLMKATEAKYQKYLRDDMMDSIAEDGSVRQGSLHTRIRREDGKIADGPVSAFLRRDKAFDEDEAFTGLSEEQRRRFNEEFRPKAREYFADRAAGVQIKQEEQTRQIEEREAFMTKRDLVNRAVKPGEEAAWNSAADEFAEMAAKHDLQVPSELEGEAEVQAGIARRAGEIKRKLYQQRFATRAGVFASFGADSEEDAREWFDAMGRDVKDAESFGLAEPDRAAMALAMGEAVKTRNARIEQGYRNAEAEVSRLQTAWELETDPARREEIARRMDASASALDTATPGRKDAAMAAARERQVETMAEEFAVSHNYGASPDPEEKAEYDADFGNLPEEVRDRVAKNRARALLVAAEAGDARISLAKGKIEKWTKSGMGAGAMLDRLRLEVDAGRITDADAAEARDEIRKAAAYDRAFPKERRLEMDRTLAEAVSGAFSSRGLDLGAMFQMDKDGAVAWGDDGKAVLAEGFGGRKYRTLVGRARTGIVLPGGVEAESYSYTDYSAETVRDAMSLARAFATAVAMGEAPDGDGSPAITAARVGKYLSDAMGDRFARASDEAASARINALLRAIPVALRFEEMDAAQESRRVLMNDFAMEKRMEGGGK